VENNTTSTALSEVSVRLYSLVADIHLVRRCQSQLIVCIFIFKKISDYRDEFYSMVFLYEVR